MRKAAKFLRTIAVATLGFSVLIVGLILIPLPGPGLLVTIAGLFILSLEFAWADRHFQRVKTAQKKVVDAAKNKRSNSNKNT